MNCKQCCFLHFIFRQQAYLDSISDSSIRASEADNERDIFTCFASAFLRISAPLVFGKLSLVLPVKIKQY